MVLFLCRNKSSRNDLKLHGEYFWNISKILVKESTSGGPHPVHEGGGLAHRLGRAPLSCGPPEAPLTSTPTPYFHVRGEKIREKVSSRFTTRSRRQALISLGRADLESVQGFEEGIRRRRHHQPSSISNFMMLTAVRE